MSLQSKNFNSAFGRILLSGVLLSFVAPGLRAGAQTPAASPTKDLWIGTYINGKKAGYTSVSTKSTQYGGKDATETLTHSLINLQMFGATVTQDVTQKTVSDAAGKPLLEVFDIASSGSAMHVDARYDYVAGEIICLVGKAPSLQTKTIKIPKGANLAGDTTFGVIGQPVVGQKYTYYALDPLSVRLQPSTVQVIKKANTLDAISGKEVSAYVVKADTGSGVMTAWVQNADSMVRAEIALGPVTMSMWNETKERALETDDADPGAKLAANTNSANGSSNGKPKRYTPPADFAVATAMISNKTLPDPRRLHSLQVGIDGIPDRNLILSDARQRVSNVRLSGHNRAFQANYDIEARPFNAEKSAQFPVSDAALTPYLGGDAYLETENPEIKATALKLRGQEMSLYTVAVKIRDWVSKSMTPDASIGVPRSASDIYEKPRGVCRDYATLYTAIARAAGIPTRLCAGIVYANGRFFYHAWAESYVGEWVTFDPTLYDSAHPVSYVDATHIKFAQGDVMQMFEVVAIVGRLHLTVQKFAM